MPCENASACPVAELDVGTAAALEVTTPLTLTLTPTQLDGGNNDTSGALPGPLVSLERSEVIFILGLSLLTVVCNLLALFLTKFAGGGHSPTMVFVRMLCVSDVLVGCYGVGKMVMFLFVDGLIINFFLPESLLFTATTASCLSLLLLSVDRSLEVSAPLWYAQNVDKPSIITGMVFLWNVSFVLGFLPLLGWNLSRKRYVLGFFQFLPWRYLLVMGLLWLACVGGSTASLLLARGRVDGLTGPALPGPLASQRSAEAEKYRRLRVTIAVDLATWALCYLPFLIFVLLVSDAGPLGGRADRNRSVYHFVPVFVLRSLAGAGVQVYRTVHVQGLAKPERGSGSGAVSSSPGGRRGHPHPHRHRRHHHRFHKRSFGGGGGNGVATISYSNPENSALTEVSVFDDSVALSAPAFVGFAASGVGGGGGGGGGDDDGQGIANPAFRPSIQLDLAQGVLGCADENTAL